MKLFVFILLATLTATLSSFGQTLIAVQNGGTPEFFNDLPEAVANAQNKDTIYIPGGAFALNGTLVIDKELHIIGVGHHPDSTAATGKTLLNGNILIQNGASNGSLTGFLLNGNILIGRTDVTDEVSNFTVERCNIGTVNFQKNGSQDNACTYFTIKENVLRDGCNGGNTQNNAFFNNFISYRLNEFSLNNVFRNNIIGYFGYYEEIINGCIIENNIIGVHYTGYGNGSYQVDQNLRNCTINNNCVISGAYIGNSENNSFRSNYIIPDFFEFGFWRGGFSYTDNYHVQSTSPGKNGGTDGTDVGLYGGVFPWKDGSIPSNPHFQSVQISGKTDNSGMLNVKIKVAAQDR